jgi:hypothetical protein
MMRGVDSVPGSGRLARRDLSSFRLPKNEPANHFARSLIVLSAIASNAWSWAEVSRKAKSLVLFVIALMV